MSTTSQQMGESDRTPVQRIAGLIVDDHAVVRPGLRTFLELQDDMVIVGEVANGLAAIEAAKRHQPDIVLLDLVMPKLGGVEATPGVFVARFGNEDEIKHLARFVWQSALCGEDGLPEKFFGARSVCGLL